MNRKQAAPVISVEAATEMARQAHAGQVDKAGADYFLHVCAVRDLLTEYGEDAQVAGVLHDVLEDTAITVGDLLADGVPEHVISAVESVTRRAGETYMELIQRAAVNPLGRLVKLADNSHNLNRLGLLPPDQAAPLRRRYKRARKLLLDPFATLLERSSLGTPQARGVRALTPPGAVEEIRRRLGAGSIDAGGEQRGGIEGTDGMD
jgi:(p)ppGpp synthase/HD superfamily hydrolase